MPQSIDHHMTTKPPAAMQIDADEAARRSRVIDNPPPSQPLITQLLEEARFRKGPAAVKAVVRAIVKSAYAHGVDWSGIARRKFSQQKSSLGNQFVRIVNYHDTPLLHARKFKRQLEWCAKHFSPVGEDDLAGLLNNGEWNKPKPGLIISFDDGLRSNYEVAAPLLEHFGFVGWFFIPTDFINTPPSQQIEYAREKYILGVETEPMAMSWDELRRLSNKHVIGAHTQSHRRMTKDLSQSEIESEIAGSKSIIEEQIGKPIRSFCWVGGETHAYQPAAAKCVRDAGYDFAFMTCSEPVTASTNPYQLHRTHLECYWALAMVRLQTCGIADAFNDKKRAVVNRITDIDSQTISN